MATSAPTPDFYSYPWQPLASARIDGSFVKLRWEDGATYDAFDLWLRENAVDAGGVDLATREGIMDPAHHVDGPAASAVTVDLDGALRITWEPDGAEALYHPGWLRHVADNRHRPSSYLPDPVIWTSAIAEPPTYDGANVLTDAGVLQRGQPTSSGMASLGFATHQSTTTSCSSLSGDLARCAIQTLARSGT